ncbi:MAG: glycosyltransferase family 2 protein [Pseudomonadota bacterium]
MTQDPATSNAITLWSAGRSAASDGPAENLPDVTVIIVSYNTRELTLACLDTLLTRGGDVTCEVIVYDNASQDGSAEAIAAAFPQVTLIASKENLGFAKANNIVADMAAAPFLLLLNPDTETYEKAIENLLAFSRAHPEAGIVGGRTYYPDGSLNPSSCWNRITPLSQLFRALNIDSIFPNSPFFNYEAIGGWQRDSVRAVDIVVGCFLMMPKALWDELGGFDLKYFMYGEEADLCHRARKLGYQPMITPEANIMHLVGASSSGRAEKVVLVAKARATLIRDHWARIGVPLGLSLLWLWAFLRFAGSALRNKIKKSSASTPGTWAMVWQHRKDWLKGY